MRRPPRYAIALCLVCGLLLPGCNRAEKQRQELAAFVTTMTPFAKKIRAINASIVGGAKKEQLWQDLKDAQEALAAVERPITDNQDVVRLYDKAAAVRDTVQQSSDQAVRMLSSARDDIEFNTALAKALPAMIGSFNNAANAFLQEFDAATKASAPPPPGQ